MSGIAGPIETIESIGADRVGQMADSSGTDFLEYEMEERPKSVFLLFLFYFMP